MQMSAILLPHWANAEVKCTYLMCWVLFGDIFQDWCPDAVAGQCEHIAQGVFTALKTTKSDIWSLSSYELRAIQIAVRHLFNLVARGATMATCIRWLHCWKLSLFKCWVQPSRIFKILSNPFENTARYFSHFFISTILYFFCRVETVEIVLTNQPVSLTWFSACAGHPGNVAKKNPFVTWIYITKASRRPGLEYRYKRSEAKLI